MANHFDRGDFIKSLADYYALLSSSGLFPPEAVQHPPPEGWPLVALSIPPNRSEAAIAILRHIPYLKVYVAPDGTSSPWPVLVQTHAISYLEPLAEDHPSLPPDTVLLARGHGRDPTFRHAIKNCTLDCATGEVSAGDDDSGPGVDFFEAQADHLRDQTVMPLPPVDDLAPELFSDRWGRDEGVRRQLQGVQVKCGWTGTYNVLVWNRARFLREMAVFRRTRRKIEESRSAREALYDDEDDGDWKASDDGMEVDGSEATSASGGCAGKVDESDTDDEMEVDEVASEVAAIWADLDESEFTSASNQLAKENIPHHFSPLAADYTPARLAIPSKAPPQSAASIRDALIDGLTRYYTLLTRAAYFPADAVEYPPPGGWQSPVFPEEKLRALKYSDQVVDVLRHLPYLREDEGGSSEDDGRWQVFDYGYPIRYLSDGHLLRDQSVKKLEKNKLERLGLSPYKTLMPSSMVAIVRAKPDWDRHWWVVDLEKGEIMVDDGTINSHTNPPEKMPWLRNKAEPITCFFDRLIHRLVTLDLVPVPDLGRLDGMYEEDVYGPEIWGGIAAKEADNARGAMDLGVELARDIYLEHGWPSLEFRREECVQALTKMRQNMWRHLQEQSRKLFDAEYADEKHEADEHEDYDDDVDMK